MITTDILIRCRCDYIFYIVVDNLGTKTLEALCSQSYRHMSQDGFPNFPHPIQTGTRNFCKLLKIPLPST